MHRTNTTNFLTFNLPFPDEATFTFTSSLTTSRDAIRITIPPSSSWCMPFHWNAPPWNWNAHRNGAAAAACARLSCLSGSLRLYGGQGTSGGNDRIISAGVNVRSSSGYSLAWDRPQTDTQVSLVVDMVADHALWRNICSAVLDKDIFPQLASTPWWLKALFAILAVVPSWRNALLSLMLWIQLQAIFLAHGFHVYHGCVPVTWLWILQPFDGRPPLWARRLQTRSFIAKAVMTTTYWAGTLLLGMKGNYAEYTPNRDYRDEKHQIFYN
jgi:hypothetical protein